MERQIGFEQPRDLMFPFYAGLQQHWSNYIASPKKRVVCGLFFFPVLTEVFK